VTAIAKGAAALGVRNARPVTRAVVALNVISEAALVWELVPDTTNHPVLSTALLCWFLGIPVAVGWAVGSWAALWWSFTPLGIGLLHGLTAPLSSDWIDPLAWAMGLEVVAMTALPIACGVALDSAFDKTTSRARPAPQGQVR
jgi:hypothetical protein